MKNNLKSRVAALLCAVALLVTAVPVRAASVPTISVESAAVTQGGTCTVTVTGRQLSALTSLKLTIAYNADVFAVTETVVRSMDVATADSKTQAGFIEYIGISMNGISGTCELLSITFRAAANAPVGEYPVTLFCGGATADQGRGDENISVSVAAGTLTVAESGEVYFDIYPDKYMVESGDEVTLTVSSWSLNNLAGGKFTFLYDSNFFAYQSLELLSTMTASEHVHTVNAANEGRITLSYAAEEPVSGGELMRITLAAKDNVSGTAQIAMETAELVDINVNPLSAGGTSAQVTIAEKSRVWLELPEDMNTHESFTVGFWAEGVSGLAAGDFTVRYDSDLLECLSVTSSMASGEGTTGTNAFVVINDAWQAGMIAFSVLCANGISADTCFLTMEFRARNNTQTDVELTPVVETTPVNRQGIPITLACPTAVGMVEVPDHTCINGYCTVCEKDVVTIGLADGVMTLSVPGVVSGGMILTACYNSKNRMLASYVAPASDEPMIFNLSRLIGVAKVSVFVTDSHWVPVRVPISEEVSIEDMP